MKVVFTKSYMLYGTRKMVVGAKAVMFDGSDILKEVLEKGVAQQYDGPMNIKIKTDFFKPK
jgi:hypothetical protein